MHYLGLDIGGTKIAAVVMDAHGWEIRRYRCPTQKSTYQQFVSCVVALIEQIRRDCNQVNHLIPTRVLVKGGEITCKILK